MNKQLSIISFFSVLLLFFFSCSNSSKENEQSKDSEEVKTDNVQTFWPNAFSKDSLVFDVPEKLDQAMANYISSLASKDSSYISNSLDGIDSLLDDEKLYTFWDQVDHYAYHPNSPLRDDEVSLFLFQSLLKIPNVNETYKVTYSHKVNLLKKNRIGHKAVDFEYFTPEGKTQNMSDIKAAKLITIFYDPTCHTCEGVIDLLKSSEKVNKAIEDNKVSILSVNVFEGEIGWEAAQYKLPKTWINGWDKNQEILLKEKYNLLAYPTIYVFDENKVVLYKDITVDKLLEIL